MMSEKKKGMTAWNKGMHWSDESKKRMSIAHIGIYPSKETLVKRSLSLTGLKHKPLSDVARANISRGHIGIKPTDETRAKMRKCTLNEAAFTTVTEQSAYWIGMFIADGNVSIKKGVPIIALHLQERDRDHVDKKFRVFVNSSHKLGCYVNKKTRRIYYSISFSSGRIANDLGNYGVLPKKRFTAKVRGGLENNKDLWRGVIDGDGTMGIYHRVAPIGTARDIPYISLTGSLHVCLQFKAFLENAIGISMPTVIPYKRSYMFSVSDHRDLNSIKLLYECCTVALERKLILAQKIMNSFQVLSSSRYIKRLWP